MVCTNAGSAIHHRVSSIMLRRLNCGIRRVCAFYEENRLRVKVNELFLDKLSEVAKEAYII